MIRVFIGYDSRESVAFSVLSHSIQTRSSEPVLIAPVMLTQLPMFHRERHSLQSTDFSFSRFLVPYLCNYEGWALFVDCDILALDDIAQLWKLRDDLYSVQVVKHDHRPDNTIKFLGAEQTRYPKKNWSSVMLMNCSRCTRLTPEYVNTATGLELHQFKWLHEDEVGEIPAEWNHLAGYSQGAAKLVHYTDGGPWFEGYENCDFADEWRQAKANMLEPEGLRESSR
jgi:lipopolysaccharide biosynthesis glycosyltransferase